MNTADLSDEQILNYYLEHVRYEVHMLLNMTIGIVAQLEIHQGLQHAPVESFAIHLRNLITFLYPNSARPTDVCADNFFLDASTWGAVRPPLSEIIASAKVRADKEIGHLTTARQSGTPASKVWDVKKLSGDVVDLMRLFSESADRVDLHSSLDDLLVVNARIQSAV